MFWFKIIKATVFLWVCFCVPFHWGKAAEFVSADWSIHFYSHWEGSDGEFPPGGIDGLGRSWRGENHWSADCAANPNVSDSGKAVLEVNKEYSFSMEHLCRGSFWVYAGCYPVEYLWPGQSTWTTMNPYSYNIYAEKHDFKFRVVPPRDVVGKLVAGSGGAACGCDTEKREHAFLVADGRSKTSVTMVPDEALDSVFWTFGGSKWHRNQNHSLRRPLGRAQSRSQKRVRDRFGFWAKLHVKHSG